MLRALAANLDLKVIAVVLATALWWFVATTDTTQVALAAPVEYGGLTDDRIVVGALREAVEVRVQAVRWLATRLGPDSLKVKVNLADIALGDSVVDLQPEDVQAPPGVVVTRVTPSRLRLTLEKAHRRVVRVAPQVAGMPAAGYVMDRVTAEPASVQIKGPRTTIEQRDAVPTAPVDVSGSRQTVTRTVALALPESVIATKERSVHVIVEIRPETEMQRDRKASNR
jgi:YbbR domain-containing protein